MSVESKIKILKDRAKVLKKVRSFFYKKKILEVDPPILVKHPTIDLHIESIETKPTNLLDGYLHTSPEYTMKRIIAQNLRDIFFLGHVFRKNEIGKFHNIEFTMIEWYKSNVTFNEFLKDNTDLIKLFINFKKIIKISYFDLFFKNFKIDIFKISAKELFQKCKNLNINFSSEKFEKQKFLLEDFLNLLLDYFFENLSEKDALYIVYDFPKHEAALAKIKKVKNNLVAKRFEFFINGHEIANGYFELNDEKVLRERFKKIINKKKNLTLDNNFLKSINNIGNCYGIAIGFDRLMMLRHKSKNIKDVIFLSFDEL